MYLCQPKLATTPGKMNGTQDEGGQRFKLAILLYSDGFISTECIRIRGFTISRFLLCSNQMWTDGNAAV